MLRTPLAFLVSILEAIKDWTEPTPATSSDYRRVEHLPEARKQAHLYGKGPRLVPHDDGGRSRGNIRGVEPRM